MTDTALAFAAGVVVATVAWPVALAVACYLERAIHLGTRHLDGPR